MSGETEKDVSGWTIDTAMQYFSMQHRLEEKFYAERDRRYADVALANAEALKIKEAADRDALQLARDIQTYKDQQHNGLLQQLDRERERGATKDDLAAAVHELETQIKPLAEYVTGQTGRLGGTTSQRDNTRQITTLAISVLVLLVAILSLYAATHHHL